MNLTSTTKVLIFSAAFFFLVGFLGLFFVKTKAHVQEIQRISFMQGGYPGTSYRGTQTFKGGSSVFSVAKYTYSVDQQNYSGTGLAEDYNGKNISIKYSSLIPAISISSSFPYFFMAFLLSVLAIGVRCVVTWYRSIVNRSGQ